MIINLLSIVSADGKSLSIDENLDFSSYGEYGIEFSSPIHIRGRFTNIASSIEFTGEVDFCARYMCDRCGEWFDESLSFEFSEILKRALDKKADGDENPDIIFFEGNSVDISEIVYNNIYMNLPSKHLCHKDCKGICPECGQNLNKKLCSCKSDYTDPRFDVLDKFFN